MNQEKHRSRHLCVVKEELDMESKIIWKLLSMIIRRFICRGKFRELVLKVHEVEKWFYSRGAGQHGPAAGG